MDTQGLMKSCQDIKCKYGLEVFQDEKRFLALPLEEFGISRAQKMQISLLLSQTNLGELLVQECTEWCRYEITLSIAVKETGLSATNIAELMNAMIGGCVAKNIKMPPRSLESRLLSLLKEAPSFIATPAEQILLNTIYYENSFEASPPVRAFQTELLGPAQYQAYLLALSEDPNKALSFLQISADEGYGQAQKALGLHYYTGDIAPVNYQKAWFYLTIPGIPVSKRMLAALADMSEKRSVYKKANCLVLTMAIILCLVSLSLCFSEMGFALFVSVLALLSSLLVLCYLILRRVDKFYVAFAPMLIMSVMCGLQCAAQLI